MLSQQVCTHGASSYSQILTLKKSSNWSGVEIERKEKLFMKNFPFNKDTLRNIDISVLELEFMNLFD